jgi:hypothetical protein
MIARDFARSSARGDGTSRASHAGMPPFMLLMLFVMCGALVLIVDACSDERRWTEAEAPPVGRDDAAPDAHPHRHDGSSR